MATTTIEDWEDGDLTTLASNWDGWTGDTASLTNQTSVVLDGNDTGELQAAHGSTGSDTRKVVETTRDSAGQIEQVTFSYTADATGDSIGDPLGIYFYDDTDTFQGALHIITDVTNSNFDVYWLDSNNNQSIISAGISFTTRKTATIDIDYSNDSVTATTDGLSHTDTWPGDNLHDVRLKSSLDSSETGEVNLYVDNLNETADAPAAPSGFGIDLVSGNDFTFSWTDNSTTESSFGLLRATATGSVRSDYTEVQTFAENATSGTHTVPDDGTTYHFRLVAQNSEGESSMTSRQSGTSHSPAPTLDSLSVSADDITVTLTENGDGEADHDVLRRRTNTTTFSVVKTFTAQAGTGNQLTFNDTGRLDGEKYDYKIRTNYTDTTAESTIKSATTELPDVGQPSLGNGVEDEVSVSWSDVIDYGDYRIQIEETGTGSDWVSTDAGWAETTVGEATTSHNFTGREDGEEYRVRMRTETEHATGAWTSPVSIVTKFPAASSLSGTVQSTTQIDLAWTDNSDNEDNFIVERREVFRTGAGPWSDVATLSANTTSYSDTGLNIDTTYDYRIRAETEHTTATSGTVQATTNDDGVITDQPPAKGWHVVIEDPQGAVYRPPIVGQPQINPKLNDLPTATVPVARNERWEDAQWERQPMRVYHDGERQPIEEVQNISQDPDRSVIVGVGGVELRQRISLDIIEQDAHTTADNQISNNTTYTANVDDPAATTTSNVLEQSSDSQSEWNSNLLNAPAADDIYATKNGFLQSRQTAYFIEAEDADTHIDDGEIIEQDSSRWSGNTIKELNQVEQNNAFRKIEHTFTIDHKIPESRVEAQVRIQVPQTGNHGFEIRINGNVIEDIGPDTLVDNETEPDWFLATVSSGDTGDLAAGDHTLTFILQESSANDGRIYADCMSLYDTKASQNFTESVTDGVIDGPDLRPSGLQVQTADATTVRQVVGGKLESSWNNLTGSQAIAISNDSGATWPISASGQDTVSGSFGSGSTTIRARFTLGGFDDNPDVSPAGRKAPHKVDLYDLYADLEDTPLLANRSWDNSLKSVLNDIAIYGNFIWQVQYNNGFTVEWTQPGQRTASVDPSLLDYSVTTDFSAIHRKAIIYGTTVPVVEEQFTSNHDTWVALANDWMAETGETVYADDGTQFTRGSDYELKPNAGEIKVLSTGSMADSTTYNIDYNRRIRGSYTSSAHDGTYETFVDSTPAITTSRNADQAALSLVKTADSPITKATVVIQKQPTGMSLVEAVDVDQLPTDQLMETWDIDDKPGSVALQLGSREPLQRRFERIESQLAAASRKV